MILFSSAVLVCPSLSALAQETTSNSPKENYSITIDGWVPLKGISSRTLMHNFKTNADGTFQFSIDSSTYASSHQNSLYAYHLDGLIDYRALCPIIKFTDPHAKLELNNKDILTLRASPHDKHSIISARCLVTSKPL